MSTADETKLIETIERLVKKQWQDRKAPLLFSALPPQIKTEIAAYQDILNGRNLTHFVRDNMADKVKRVGHPTQKSKIGLVPCNEEYTFPDKEDDGQAQKLSSMQSGFRKNPLRSDCEKIMAFLEKFSSLSDDELKEINIPFHIIYKIATK
ncbi:hypothetical protein [Rhizobium sp.]|jgi:hypothetical protein|uniref:hypothetical protein n=1 Tax=Rhizobium sp. TaxID=391 RepID=UPI002AA70184